MRTIILVGIFLISQFALAQPMRLEPEFKEGEHYFLLPEPVPTEDPSKIEIREIFSYVCGHCYAFQPLLERWTLLEHPGISYVKMPAIFGDNMIPYAKLYYSLKALNTENLHPAIFNAIHKERQNLGNAPAMKAFMKAKGVDENAFVSAFESDWVLKQAQMASKNSIRYRLKGTPALIIDGRYRVEAKHGHLTMLRIADQLIDEIRLERLGFKPQ